MQVTSCKMGEQGHRTPFPIPVNRYEHLGREDGYKPRNAAGKTPNPLTLLQAHWKPGAPARRAETELSQSVGHFRSCARTPNPRSSTPARVRCLPPRGRGCSVHQSARAQCGPQKRRRGRNCATQLRFQPETALRADSRVRKCLRPRRLPESRLAVI